VPLNLVGVVRNCVEGLGVAGAEKNISMRYLAPKAPLIGVIGDRERLCQALTNLFQNAVKFTPEGGHIDVSLERVDGTAEIRVQDNGIGISPAFLPHVFERFQQADVSPVERQHGGLGLGLAIVKHLVERHSGTVQAESPGEGMGATFVVTLPLAADQAACAEESAPEDAKETLGHISVLLVEDDEDTLEALRLVLEHSGARVLAATSAPEALALFERERPTVVVSDISMPGSDGYELIRQFRTRDGQRITAVAMTGLASM
jgi:CheY-like chemotaxis protein